MDLCYYVYGQMSIFSLCVSHHHLLGKVCTHKQRHPIKTQLTGSGHRESGIHSIHVPKPGTKGLMTKAMVKYAEWRKPL